MGCRFHLYGTRPGAGCPWAHAWVPKRAGQGLPLTVPFSLRSSLRSNTSTAPLRPVPATGGLPTDSRGWSLPTKWAAPSWLGHQQVGSNVGKFPERAERHLVTCPCCVATHLVVGLMSESTTWAGAHSGDWRGSSSCSMHPQASAFVFKGNYTHTSQFLEWWVRRWQASCSPAILNVHFYSCYSRGKTAGGITEGGGSCFCSFPPSFFLLLPSLSLFLHSIFFFSQNHGGSHHFCPHLFCQNSVTWMQPKCRGAGKSTCCPFEFLLQWIPICAL